MMTKATPSLNVSRAPRTRRAPTLIKRVLTFLAIWQERQSLTSLDSHLLRDIGKTRAEVDREAKRAAWDAPSRWMR